MSRRTLLLYSNWTFWTATYLAFLGWHGNFSSPLSPTEIDHYAHELHKLHPDRPIQDYKVQLAMDNGEPIFMVNAIKYFDTPVKTKEQNEDIEAQELVKKYNHYVGQFLLKRGSYPVFLGKATGETATAWGVSEADASGWSDVVIVRYRNLRTLLVLATDEEFNRNLEYKRASLEKTIVFPTARRLVPASLELLIFFILLSVALSVQLLIQKKFRKRKLKY